MAPEGIIGNKFQQKHSSQNSFGTAWKPKLWWILLLSTAILLFVVERSLSSNNDKNLFYPHDNPHNEHLDGRKNYDSDNDVPSLPLCQRTDQFITFYDVDGIGFGLLHKLEDFLAAFQAAILTNRTLIDYAPSLTRRCNLNVNGSKRREDLSTSFLWKFSDLFDLTNLHFAYRIENEEHNCRLSVVTDDSDKIHMNSVLKFEYGLPDFKKTKAFHIKDFLSKWATLKHQRETHVKPMYSGKPPFSKFFRNAAEAIKRQCMMSTISNSFTQKFYVIHLRGTDRSCMIDLMTSSYLIGKIESLNITKNDVIYLMTDMGREHDKVRALKQHFGGSLFMASDIDIFSASPFKEDNYIVFTAELALQKISDGYVSTYKDHAPLKEENQIGTLMQWNCQRVTMEKMTPEKVRQMKSIYKSFSA